MKVSLIIPIYNEENYIAKTLEAIRNQIIQPDEIIIVDNNSTDKSIEIIKSIKVDVTIIQEKTQGMTYARNAGFNKASYEIIARCDADTLPEKDWIKKIKNNFENKQIDALSGPLYFYETGSTTTFYSKIFLFIAKLLNGGHDVLLGPNMSLKKTVWEKIKNNVCMDNTKVHEDMDLSIHIKKAGGKVMIDDSLHVGASARRIKNNPLSFFTEYPFRLLLTFISHLTSRS